MKKIIIFLSTLSFVLLGLQQVEAKRVMELKIGKGEAKVNLLEGSAEGSSSGEESMAFLEDGRHAQRRRRG